MQQSPKRTSLVTTNILEFGLKTYPHDGADFVVVELCVDGDALADFSYYATDLEELTRSLDTDGKFCILTCWCGVPECAGIYSSVGVRHQGGRVYWHVPQPSTPEDFVFEKADLQAALLTFNKQRKRFVAERAYSDKTPYLITPTQNEPFFTL